MQVDEVRKIYDSAQEIPNKADKISRNNILASFDDHSIEQKY